jgi:hypothetical protein
MMISILKLWKADFQLLWAGDGSDCGRVLNRKQVYRLSYDEIPLSLGTAYQIGC